MLNGKGFVFASLTNTLIAISASPFMADEIKAMDTFIISQIIQSVSLPSYLSFKRLALYFCP